MPKRRLQVGDRVASFTLKNQSGKDFSIDELLGNKNLVIYFYPKDETKVCTAQACGFRDAYEEFKDLDCEVIGISSDNEKSHQKFIANHKLPFILLSDAEKSVRKLFGVPKDLFGLLPGRYTYITDKEGVIIKIFNSAFSAGGHIEEALKALKA